MDAKVKGCSFLQVLRQLSVHKLPSLNARDLKSGGRLALARRSGPLFFPASAVGCRADNHVGGDKALSSAVTKYTVLRYWEDHGDGKGVTAPVNASLAKRPCQAADANQ